MVSTASLSHTERMIRRPIQVAFVAEATQEASAKETDRMVDTASDTRTARMVRRPIHEYT